MEELDSARRLISYIDASPSPFHAVAAAAEHLQEAGFHRVDPSRPWPELGRGMVASGGSLVAWLAPATGAQVAQLRIITAHTDSPNLRIKPNPDIGRAGCRQLGVEVYGSALLNSWLDRDLGISGRVAVRGPLGPELRLIRVDRPVLRIPQLAPHLDREVLERGLRLDRQRHLAPIWALGAPEDAGFSRFLADELGVDDVLSWEVMAHDLTPPTLAGRDEELISSPRIDNLASCWAACTALADAARRLDRRSYALVCLYDHEEVGSTSATGADGTLLTTVVERLFAARSADRERMHRSLAESLCASVDGAHATNPNYAEQHEPSHQIRLNAGPVIKTNANRRYATDAETSAHLMLACERAGVPFQQFVVRSDLPCGSTVGPMTAARLGVPTVDVGIAQLAMHSARELCGSEDPSMLVAALGEWLLT